MWLANMANATNMGNIIIVNRAHASLPCPSRLWPWKFITVVLYIKKDLIYIKASYFFLGTILCLLCSKMRLCNADTNQVTIIFLFTVITISSLITNSGGSKVEIDQPFKRLQCSKYVHSINKILTIWKGMGILWLA